MNLEAIKKQLTGQWKSISVEIRPSATKDADGNLKPFYLKRLFTYRPDDTFELQVTSFADPFGQVPLAQMNLVGTMDWVGEHPIAQGAQKVNFIAGEEYTVTPLNTHFVQVLNQVSSADYEQWKIGETQSVFKKAFIPFGLSDGQIFAEYDLVYLFNDCLFWGARNIDGRGFDTEENRPTNLQIPLVRV